MSYEIIETKTFSVGDNTFDTLQNAQLYVLRNEVKDKVWNVHGSFMECIRDDPRYLIELLEQYMRDREKILYPQPAKTHSNICEAEFDREAAFEASQGDCLHYIYNWYDMVKVVDHMLARSHKLSAIKLVRSCFSPCASLREAKEWVEARQAELVDKGILPR